MKPYDGGQWVGVTRIKDEAMLRKTYDESGERLMHLQESIEGFDKFARSLSIGAETMVMDFRPDEPMHNRYAVSHDFLTPETGDEVLTISRLINAFFRWEFNSCETLVRGDRGAPDRLRQRVAGRRADVAALLLPVGDQRAVEVVDLLHRHGPRAARRGPRHAHATSRSATARTSPTSEKLAEYRRLADEYFEVEQYTGVLRDLAWRTSTS